MTMCALRALVAPCQIQRLNAKRAIGRPSGATFRARVERDARAAKRLSGYLKVQHETTTRVRADQKVLHRGRAPLRRGYSSNWYYASIPLITSVPIRKGPG